MLSTRHGHDLKGPVETEAVEVVAVGVGDKVAVEGVKAVAVEGKAAVAVGKAIPVIVEGKVAEEGTSRSMPVFHPSGCLFALA